MYVLSLLYLERGMVPKQYIAKKKLYFKIVELKSQFSKRIPWQYLLYCDLESVAFIIP